MINCDVYEKEIQKGNIKNGYIFCGLDEELIKDEIEFILKKQITEDFKELNLIRIDGMNTSFNEIIMHVKLCHLCQKRKL